MRKKFKNRFQKCKKSVALRAEQAYFYIVEQFWGTAKEANQCGALFKSPRITLFVIVTPFGHRRT